MYQRDQYEAARGDFERFIAQPDRRFEKEKFAYIFHALGVMFRPIDKRRAIHYLNQCLLFDDRPEIFHKMAYLFIEQGNVPQAKSTLQEGLRRHPHDQLTRKLSQSMKHMH